jgi:predicted DNA-binding protein
VNKLSGGTKMERQVILDCFKRDIEQLGETKAKMAREIILPLIEKMDDFWLEKHWDLQIGRITILTDGQPDMKRVKRIYPELLKGAE